jgi:hypothetical protein
MPSVWYIIIAMTSDMIANPRNALLDDGKALGCISVVL